MNFAKAPVERSAGVFVFSVAGEGAAGEKAGVSGTTRIGITGLGLAGTCVAAWLEKAGVAFRWRDERWSGAASPVAAGLVNPVTGKNFEPSGDLATHLPRAVAFYEDLERRWGGRFWSPLPVVRMVGEKDWPKVERKLGREDVAQWVERVEERVDGWRAMVTLRGGGRVDVPGLIEAARRRFSGSEGFVEADLHVRCEGAAGLLRGQCGGHRSAQGEILTLRVPGADEGRIVVAGGGWLVPIGGGLFKAGATYEWERLDGEPTEAGRRWVEELLGRMGVRDFEVIDHQAGVRPIVRRSIPVVEWSGREVIFNGLGSKGSLYGPGTAEDLVREMVG